MNVSSIYASMSRVLICWCTRRLPTSGAEMVADLLVVQEVLDSVSRWYRAYRLDTEGE